MQGLEIETTLIFGSSAESLLADTEQCRITPRSAVSPLLHSTLIFCKKRIFILKSGFLQDIFGPYKIILIIITRYFGQCFLQVRMLGHYFSQFKI